MTLIDGRQVDSASEDWRHECEAAHVLSLPLPERGTYLAAIEHRRGADAAMRLRETITQLWKARK